MGLPVMTVIFQTAAKNTIRRSERGVVGMVVKAATVPSVNPVVIYKEKDIPKDFSEDLKQQVLFALKGNVNAPLKVVCYVLKTDAEDYTEALEYFELKKANWLCFPSASTDTQTDSIAEWVKNTREAGNKVKVILPQTEADHEGVINYANEKVTVNEKDYTAEQFCSRIAGLLAGTPSKQGATYAVLDEVAEFKNPEKAELDDAIEKGKFMLFFDGEKVKVARAVNSLTTVDEGKGEAWKKIKVVETMDMINDDLVLLVEDNYIGKYQNTFDNKCLLLSAVQSYFEEIARSGLIDGYTVNFDTEAIADYLITSKGYNRDDVEAMKEEELKKQYTDEKVFLAATITVVDVMEDITLQITV